MAFPTTTDRPDAGHTDQPTPPVSDSAPPLAPASPEQSPWWSAPAGKPFGIPDFAHEFRALLAWLFPAPQPVPVPVRVTARRRR
jgi:hypothetical protein